MYVWNHEVYQDDTNDEAVRIEAEVEVDFRS